MAEPLSRPGPATGSTLFVQLPAEQTGIVTENRYADPRIWTERYHEFSIGAIGTGVTVGDFDNDGRPDLFVVSKTESCRLFRNLGDWKFEDVTAHAGVEDRGTDAREWKQGAAFVDVNNDGWLDLYVCRHAAPNRLYINQRDGTFREEAAARGLAVNDACGMAAFADFDRDGWLDVYVQTNVLDAAQNPPGRRDYLFRNTGDGHFVDVSAAAGIRGESQGHSATWWDYDDDGWPDLYVANDFQVHDILYRNNGDGTFTNVLDAVVPVTPYHSMGADLGDLTNDGRIDFFVADMARTSVARDRATIADTRARTKTTTPRGTAMQVMRNALYVATGTGHFLEVAEMAGLAATDWTWSVRCEDLDDDGRLDLHVTNGMVRDYDNADLRARTMAVESSAERVRLMRNSPPAADPHLAFRNRGDLQFEDVSAAWGLAQRGVSFGAAFGDFDGDGDLDLVFANYQAGVTVLRNEGTEGGRLIVALRGTRSNRFGVGAVVRLETDAGPQVRTLSLARGYLSTSEPVLHFGLGEATTIRRLTVRWPSGAFQEFGDVAPNQRLIITEPLTSAAPVSVTEINRPWYSASEHGAVFARSPRNESSAEPPEQPFVGRTFTQGASLAAGDIDGDGIVDVVQGGAAGEAARWWRGHRDGTWTLAGEVGTPSTLPDGPVALLDADGDGRTDILMAKRGDLALAGAPDYQPRLWLQRQPGAFTAAPAGLLPALRVSAGAVVVADFDRDGRPDVFLGGRLVPNRYPASPPSALWLNHGDHFEDVTEVWAREIRSAGMVTAATVADVDGDGWPDLVAAVEWGAIRCWRNREGRGFDDVGERLGFAAAGHGLWSALAVADFNADGRPDFAVGNLGLNTPYTASVERPALLYFGNFGGETPLALEAEWDGDRIVPRLARIQLASRLPALRGRFPRNESYARATLADIVGAEALAAAQRWSAEELRSGMFLSRPDGTYRFVPLPRIAQIAPATALVAGDFDGDGKSDLFIAQNSFAPVTRIGRFSGGLGQLLRGDGQGGFTPIEPRTSGLIIPGETSAAVALGPDPRSPPALLVIRPGNTPCLYVPNPKPHSHVSDSPASLSRPDPK